MPTNNTANTTTRVEWPEPDGPDHGPIGLLHRDHDGSIAFHRNEGQGIRGVASIPAKLLGQVFPAFLAPLLDEDAYFTINGMMPTEFIRGDARPDLFPAVPDGMRANIRRAVWGTDKLRYLTAAFVDFDFYKIPGMTIGQAVGVVVDAQERGVIPPATMLYNSGRGLWAFWFLRDDKNPDGPVRGWAEATGTYNRIQRALQRLFTSIEPDYGAKDTARITRVPGSLNTKAGRRVTHFIQADERGPFVYRLDELAALLNVTPTRLPDGMRKAVDPKNRERGIKGHEILNRRRLDRLAQLISERGKIQEGCRNRCALLLTAFSWKCKIEDDENRDTLWRFGKFQCSPPLSDSELWDAYKKRRTITKINNRTIADWLGITPAESELTGWDAKGQHGPETDAPRTRGEQRARRRELIDSICRHTTKFPTVRELQEALEERGVSVSVETIHRDLQETGLATKNPRRRKQDDGPTLI